MLVYRIVMAAIAVWFAFYIGITIAHFAGWL